MGHTKIVKADLDSPHKELSILGLGFAGALSARSEIDFSCSSTWGPIQLYIRVVSSNIIIAEVVYQM